MFADNLARSIEQAHAAGLADINTVIWKAWAARQIADEDAQRLAEAVEARRAVLAAWSPQRQAQRLRRLQPRQIKAAVLRRRRLAASGVMPPSMACQFRPSELAVLRIVADEVREHGQCDRTLGEIAARSGTCRTSVQNAVREATRLGFLHVEERRRPGRPSLPNRIAIVSREWMAWIARGPRGEGSRASTPRVQVKRQSDEKDSNLLISNNNLNRPMSISPTVEALKQREEGCREGRSAKMPILQRS